MNDTLFRIFALAVFLSGAAISITYRRRAEQAGGEKISLKEEGLAIIIPLRLSGLAIWGCILAFMINPAWLTWSRLDLPEPLRWLGLALGISAVGLAYWVFSNLGNNVTSTVVTRANHRLVTSGPYRYIRHPLYMMGLISYLGFALLAENWFIALVTLLAFAVLVVRTGKEEARLLERFGSEYRAYTQRTGRFLPKIS
jgi:protein-S-isoprenylcysteine O-methyltransferase Ste14